MNISYLDQLEAESIHILREVAACFEKPLLLYSVGKDSSVLIRLCQKAFAPGPIPFPVLHVDTGFKFSEMYSFRNKTAKEAGLNLIIHRNEEAISNNTNPFSLGTQKCCGLLKTKALLDALRQGEYQAAIGGARRDEERSRAKERIFSFRDKFGQWDPKNQRPELWNTYNTKINQNESIRVFPISNWTELNVWHYIHREKIPIVPLYYAMPRMMHVRGNELIPTEVADQSLKNFKPQKIMSRFRSLGCSPCTGAMRSEATTVLQIIEEMMEIKVSERASRVIDHDTDGSMEIKKREGYF